MGKNHTKKHQVDLRHSVRARSALAAVALAVATTACGSSGSSEGSDSIDASAPSTEVVEASEASQAETEPETGDSGLATLTLEDGTVFEFELSNCDTSETDPSALPLSNGYRLSGHTADGAFSLSAIRAGLDDDNVVASGGFEGDFDDEGKNAQMLYSVRTDTLDVTIDGAHLSASFLLAKVGPNAPYGDEVIARLEADC